MKIIGFLVIAISENDDSVKIDRAVAREIVLSIGAALTRLSKFANVALGNAAGVISPEEPSRIIAKKVHTLRELERISAHFIQRSSASFATSEHTDPLMLISHVHLSHANLVKLLS